jgi:hypothetical protein
MSSQKGLIIVTVLVGLLGAAVALYTHFDTPETDILGTTMEKAVGDDPSERDSSKSPSINISEVFITPIDTNMPSNFYAQVSNTGTGSAEDFEVFVDFGESTIEACEWSPKSIARTTESDELSVQILKISSLKKDTSLHLTCSINLPYFKRISVGGGNIKIEKSLGYEAYKEMKAGEGIPYFTMLWRTFFTFFCALLFFKLVGWLFD